MRLNTPLVPLLALLALAACSPPVPDSGPQGAGFDTPDQFAQRREAELRGGIVPSAAIPAPATTTIRTAPISEAEQLASDTRAVLGGAPDTSFGAPVPLPTAAQPAVPGASVDVAAVELSRDNPELSREQDFGAVSAERSIQDDAARVTAARQQYQMVQPTELERPDDNGPNIIAYAIERARPVGASGSYRRPALASARRSAQKCEGYRTADVAQEEFLSAGGPERDRLNLDPDGDGNACAWNPATFRNLVRN